MEPFLAQISMFGGTFAPRGWDFCHGQLLSIAQHQQEVLTQRQILQ